MALADVINAGSLYHPANSLRAAYLDRAGNLKATPSHANLVTLVDQLMPALSAPLKASLVRHYSNNIPQIATGITTRRNHSENLLGAETRANYPAVLNALPNDRLMRAAINIPDANKDFYPIYKTLEEIAELDGKPMDHKDVLGQLNDATLNSIRPLYAATYGDPVFEEIIMNPNNTEYVRTILPIYLTDSINAFINNRLFTGGALDVNRARNYLTNTIGGYRNPALENAAYFEVGKALTAP